MNRIENLNQALDIVILLIIIAGSLLLWDSRKRIKRIDRLFERLEEIKTQ